MRRQEIAIIGGGPAGLAAAEILSLAEHRVTIYDAMPSVGRKFLLAGKSGLNITHAEDYDRFVTRFSETGRLRAALDGFTPQDIRHWAAGLGTETFTGSSGRVFPTAMKASPLLRAWLSRLSAQGVTVRTRHRWTGFDNGGYRFDTPDGTCMAHCDAALLALGGASWPRLGSDAAWVPWLKEIGVPVQSFRPANCGFDVAWSPVFQTRFAGAPVKSVTASSDAGTVPGEFVISETGIEGSLVYAHTAALRDRLERDGRVALTLDLAPGRTRERIGRELAGQDSKASFSNRIRKAAGLDGVKAALLRECASDADRADPQRLAARIKALPVQLLRPRPIAEAISSAGGVSWGGIDDSYMLTNRPGLFVAGEMIDWEAPTGGYLLTACLASGRAAARGMEAWLQR